MSSFTVTLPDGSQQTVPQGTRPIDIANSISPRLASDAIVARVNGDLFDLTRPLESRRKAGNPDYARIPKRLHVYRHSTAHLLAAAVLELFPETQLGIGPPTDTGFYYDFQRDAKFATEDLARIEERMRGDPGAQSCRSSA